MISKGQYENKLKPKEKKEQKLLLQNEKFYQLKIFNKPLKCSLLLHELYTLEHYNQSMI
jgi:hypothetical protein